MECLRVKLTDLNAFCLSALNDINIFSSKTFAFSYNSSWSPHISVCLFLFILLLIELCTTIPLSFTL